MTRHRTLALTAALAFVGTTAARAHWISPHRHEPARIVRETYVEDDEDDDDDQEQAASPVAEPARESPDQAAVTPRPERPPADPAKLSEELDERVAELYRDPPSPTLIRTRFQDVVDEFLLRKRRAEDREAHAP